MNEKVPNFCQKSSHKLFSFFGVGMDFLLWWRCGAAFLTAASIVLFLGKPVISLLHAKKIGQKIRFFEGFLLASLHKGKKDTPTMGGILLFFATVVASALFVPSLSKTYAVLCVSYFLFAAIGAVDDGRKLCSKSFLGLSGKIRFFLETLIACGILWYLRMEYGAGPQTVFFPWVPSGIVVSSMLGLCVLQWFTIVGSANAVNLTDGLDGLASGLTALAVVPLIFFSLIRTIYPEISVFLSAVAGSCVGFLWYNSHPAKVFMGDTGSLALGGILGVSSVFLHAEWLLALSGILFVFETLSVIIQVISFKMTGKRVFRCTPIHHHFEYGNMSEVQVVTRFWVIAIIMAVIGVMSII